MPLPLATELEALFGNLRTLTVVTKLRSDEQKFVIANSGGDRSAMWPLFASLAAHSVVPILWAHWFATTHGLGQQTLRGADQVISAHKPLNESGGRDSPS